PAGAEPRTARSVQAVPEVQSVRSPVKPLPNFPIEPFGPQHDRPNFRCGNEALDRHFHERIRKEVEARVAAAFVMADGPLVLGYYTLSAHSIQRNALPDEIVRKLT